MEYSTDTVNWTTWDGSSISSVNGNVYLRGTGNTRVSAEHSYNGYPFVISGTDVECVGNIETLLDWQTVVNGQHPEMGNYCFAYAFKNCSSLIKSPDLPATTLAIHCYKSMFVNCTSLTTAPALPATTLADSCYNYMFYGCTSLTKAPALPATTLADYCYFYMFYGCTSLNTAPELPATNLANNCYERMFNGCTSLTKAPVLPATTLENSCYNSMFNGCTSLTTAPALPATTLEEECYRGMFYGCTNLKVSATQTGTYQYEWRIPTEGAILLTKSDWNKNMFANTGGTFTGNPTINTIYYVENEPVA